MNGMLATYESTIIESYGDSRGGRGRGRTSRQSINGTGDDDHYAIFDPGENSDVRTELEGLTTRMQNPFTNMRRWLKFELLDLRAIMGAVEKKNEMDKRRQEKMRKRDADRNEL